MIREKSVKRPREKQVKMTRQKDWMTPLVLIISILVIMYMFRSSLEGTHLTDCADNMRKVAVSALMYCADWQEFPRTVSEMREYCPSAMTVCPASETKKSYAIVKHSSDILLIKNIPFVAMTVIAVESDKDRAQFNDISWRHYGKRANFAFADGHVKAVKEDGFPVSGWVFDDSFWQNQQ